MPRLLAAGGFALVALTVRAQAVLQPPVTPPGCEPDRITYARSLAGPTYGVPLTLRELVYLFEHADPIRGDSLLTHRGFLYDSAGSTPRERRWVLGPICDSADVVRSGEAMLSFFSLPTGRVVCHVTRSYTAHTEFYTTARELRLTRFSFVVNKPGGPDVTYYGDKYKYNITGRVNRLPWCICVSVRPKGWPPADE